jgi:hypothetical protein
LVCAIPVLSLTCVALLKILVPVLKELQQNCLSHPTMADLVPSLVVNKDMEGQLSHANMKEKGVMWEKSVCAYILKLW